MPLTPEAKAALDEAVRIVREDKQYAMLHELHKRSTATPNPTPDPATPPVPQGPPAPPVVPPNDPGNQPPAPKKDAYWGELLS